MQLSQFSQLARSGEQAAEDDTRRYRQRVGAFALLGWAFVAGLVLLALALLALAVAGWRSGGIQPWLAGPAIGGSALLWMAWSAIAARRVHAEGVQVEPQEAPELFEALARLQKALKAPAIDAVRVADGFEATIVTAPRTGPFGERHELVLGWALLCALEPRRLWAVIAHEFAHLRGAPDRFSAWIYRSRVAWTRVQRHFQQAEGPAAWVLRRFFDWYAPRLNALTFALARQDDHEADRLAGRLCTPGVVAQAMLELEIKRRWFQDEYWRDLWRRAASQERPDPLPYSAMRRRVRRGPEEAEAREALRRALAQRREHDDPHPTLQQRLAALGAPVEVPAWSRHSSVRLLGISAQRVGHHFDQAWWERSRRDWARHREHLKSCLERIQALKARASQLSADEYVDWADCFEALSTDDSSLLYEHALRVDPDHPRALRRLGELRSASLHPQALDTLERLQSRHPQHAHAACTLALDLLDRQQHAGQEVDAALRKGWRERLARAEKAEAQAWEDFEGSDPCENAVAPQWTDAERRAVSDALIRTPEVQAAWVAGRTISAMPNRPYLVVFAELRRNDAALAESVRRHLMQQLQAFSPRLRVCVLHVEVKERDLDRTGAASFYRRQR